jgi:hypothetical protein
VSVEVENAATPPLSGSDPNFVVPFMKFTVPVAEVPVAVDFTVAVNVTVSPEVDGFADDTSFVAVLALVTTWVKTAEVLPAKVVLPE